MKKLSILKKVVTVLVVLVMCCVAFAGVVSAKESDKGIAKPTNTLVTNGNGGKTDVGTWFVTYNNSSEWGNNFGSGYPIKYRTLMPDGSYGILDSSKVEYIDFMLQQMADAKIDFIIFDLTNGGLTDKIPYGWRQKTFDEALAESKEGNYNSFDYTIKNTFITCERIAEWNKTHDWKIKYSLAVGVYPLIANGIPLGMATEYQAEATYKLFCENKEFGGDNYYQVDGKPLFIIFDWTKSAIESWKDYVGDKTYTDKFFLRGAQTGELGTYGWHAAHGTVPHEEVELLCPGHNTAGESGADIVRENGKTYKTGWEVVLNNKLPRILVITSFNDFNEQTAVFTADSSRCDETMEEKWTDQTGKVNPSMYWDMTKEGIRLVRTFNGDIDGEFKSNIFNLGNNSAANGSSSNTTLIIVIAVVTAVVVIAVAVVVILLLTKKKK